MKYVSVDRIYHDTALCEDEDRSVTEVPLFRLPQGVVEGSILRVLDDGAYALDEEETARRRRKNRELFDSLTEESPEA